MDSALRLVPEVSWPVASQKPRLEPPVLLSERLQDGGSCESGGMGARAAPRRIDGGGGIQTPKFTLHLGEGA